MEGKTATSPRSEKVSSLRQQRDRSPERDRHHVRFEEAKTASTEDLATNDNEKNENGKDETHFSGENPLNNEKHPKIPYSLKINRDVSDSDGENKKSGRSNSEGSEENPTGTLTAENLQIRQLSRRPDSNNYKETSGNSSHMSPETKPNNHEHDHSDDEKEANENSEEMKQQQEYAVDEAEVNSDDFNEKLASLDENTRKYYHFFHVCAIIICYVL